ncbi:hypothetical protein G5714_003296 [Onychostoma macrolepis]|uniref:Uncharacterized protein n=1 Tax=Onychostoma macrolepis TaxID=369639 RepID=A0A7J6D926_9TELE|nr:hypothetical protein G5714_003296 [Onychostoma macrolepis]
MLMENLGLERHGKLFAHYAEESKAFLRGDQQPVFGLQKMRFEEISQEEPFHIQVDETNLFTLEFAPEKQMRVMTDLDCQSVVHRVLWGSSRISSASSCMEDEEAAEALERFFCAEFIKDDLVEPLIFVFKFTQDMHTFLENVVDNMHLRIFCRTQN